jgi:nucleotide-binding universal stress UspA family protein
VEQARRRAEAQGAIAIKTSVIEGDPTEEILAYITAKSIDAVVVGRRGRSSLARLLLGSVSQKLASLAPCVVIICP